MSDFSVDGDLRRLWPDGLKQPSGLARHWRASSLWLGGLLATLVFLSGCGAPANQVVDSDVARATLVRTLEHWQSGGLSQECQSWDPPVVVGFSSWESGAKLKSFRLGESRALDANLFVNVDLELDVEGRTEKVMQQYCVSTAPVLTVFPAMQPAF